jgi:hypothetical protein
LPEETPITSVQQVRDIVADAWRESLAGAAEPATADTSQEAPLSALEARRAEGRAAAARAERRQTDVTLARAILGDDRRYDGITMSDDEALSEAGLVEPDPEPEPYLQPRTEQQQALDELDTAWWSLTEWQRREKCEELGVPFDAASGAKLTQMRADPRFNR